MWEARRAKSFKLVTFRNIRIVSTGSYSCTSRCVLHTKYLKRVPIRQFHFVGPSPMNYSSSQRSILISLRVHRIVCVCSGSYTCPARRVYFGSLSSDLQCIFIFVLVDRIVVSRFSIFLYFVTLLQIFAVASLFSYLISAGPEEDTPRPMECMEFVCRAPTELFKSRREHPPFVIPRPPDLNDLTTAAEMLLKTEGTSTTI